LPEAKSNSLLPRPCDQCSLCCKVLGVSELQKVANQWCSYFAPGKRCTIYPTRPNECRQFQCGWSKSLEFDLSWRPDRAHFVIDDSRANELMIVVDPAYPDAWRKEPYYSRIKYVASREHVPAILVQVRVRGNVLIVFPESEIDLGPNQPGSLIRSGYELRDGKPVPWARFVPKTG